MRMNNVTNAGLPVRAHNNLCCVSATSLYRDADASARAGVAAGWLSASTALMALLAFPTSSATTNTDSSSGSSHELAVWVPMQLTFPYRQFTTQYSCSGLEMRMTSLLLKLGARPDLEVRGYGCTRLTGPDPFAGVKIKMNVLEPAGPRP